MVDINDCYLDLKELSEYTCMAVSGLRDHIRNNDLPCYKVNGKYLIKKSEFDDWIVLFRENMMPDYEVLVLDIMADLE